MSIISKFNSPSFLEKLKTPDLLKDGEFITIEPGPYLPTSHELEWLQNFLTTDITETLLSEQTKEKLGELLKEIQPLNKNAWIQIKQMPQPEGMAAPFLQKLKACMRKNKGCLLTYTTKAGSTFNDEGVPIEFVYNIAKKRWYIKWMNHEKVIMMTPLDRLDNVAISEIDTSEYRKEMNQLQVEAKKAVIQWTPKYPNMDVHRLLHAFSAFRINLQDTENVTMEIYYLEEEEQFLLSKIRQFGPHIFIQSPPSLQQAMAETARRALENY